MSPRRLLDLAAMLAAAAHLLDRASDAEAARLVHLIGQSVDSLNTAAVRFDAPLAQSPARETEALARWRHDLMAPITAIVGWARLFGEAREPSARVRASEAIERNVKELGHLLAEHLGRDRE